MCMHMHTHMSMLHAQWAMVRAARLDEDVLVARGEVAHAEDPVEVPLRLLRTVPASATFGGSLRYIRWQPPLRMVTPSAAYGDSLRYIWWQPPLHRVAALEVALCLRAEPPFLFACRARRAVGIEQLQQPQTHRGAVRPHLE